MLLEKQLVYLLRQAIKLPLLEIRPITDKFINKRSFLKLCNLISLIKLFENDYLYFGIKIKIKMLEVVKLLFVVYI